MKKIWFVTFFITFSVFGQVKDPLVIAGYWKMTDIGKKNAILELSPVVNALSTVTNLGYVCDVSSAVVKEVRGVLPWWNFDSLKINCSEGSKNAKIKAVVVPTSTDPRLGRVKIKF